ncbi:MAG: hypothetical protein H8D78_03550 [Chloroflexi bacterium]|nr:hypothetical protein [Chloroflexota bacterium]
MGFVRTSNGKVLIADGRAGERGSGGAGERGSRGAEGRGSKGAEVMG